MHAHWASLLLDSSAVILEPGSLNGYFILPLILPCYSGHTALVWVLLMCKDIKQNE